MSLVGSAGERVGLDIETAGDADPRDWLPGGRFEAVIVARLPGDLAPGEYTIAFGLYDPLAPDDLAAKPVFAHGPDVVDAAARDQRIGVLQIEPP